MTLDSLVLKHDFGLLIGVYKGTSVDVFEVFLFRSVLKTMFLYLCVDPFLLSRNFVWVPHALILQILKHSHFQTPPLQR